MHEAEFTEAFLRQLRKAEKKDPVRYEAALKKIEQVRSVSNPHHYKNLRNDLKEFKRVHIDNDFIILFKIEKEAIVFEDLLHHKKAYRRR